MGECHRNALDLEINTPLYSVPMEAAVMSHFALNPQSPSSQSISRKSLPGGSRGEPVTVNTRLSEANTQLVVDMANNLSSLIAWRDELLTETGGNYWQQFVRAYFYLYCQQFVEIESENNFE